MKKLIMLTSAVLFVALSVQAADNKNLAEIIAVEYDSTILEVEKNTLKVNDSVFITPAGEQEGIVTTVDGNIVILSINNNGFAEGSKVLVKDVEKFGKLRSKKAVVKAVKLNSIILDVKNNDFKVQDRVSLVADGNKQAEVKAVDKDIVILSLNNSGFAEGSKVCVIKGKEGFKEKRK